MSRRPDLEQHPGFTLVRVAGAPYDLGLQHGRLLRDGVRRLRDAFYREVVYFRGRAFGLAFQVVMAPIVLRMHRYVPAELRAEMRGVAAGAGVRYWDILTLNCFDDLLHSLWRIPLALARLPILHRRFACSSFALLGQRTASGRLLHGRNMDYEVADYLASPGVVTRTLKENVVVIECQPEKGQGFVSVGWPGIVGVVTSLNQAGLSLACLTSTVNDETASGTPLMLLYRQISQHAASLADAQRLIRAARLTIGNNLLLASGGEDDARVFELSPRVVAVRSPRDGFLATTNHFVHQSAVPGQAGWVVPSSIDRLSRLGTLCESNGCGPEHARGFLRDKLSLAPDGNTWSCLENPGTIYSTVTEPATGRLWLRANDRPDREFVQLTASWAERTAQVA